VFVCLFAVAQLVQLFGLSDIQQFTDEDFRQQSEPCRCPNPLCTPVPSRCAMLNPPFHRCMLVTRASSCFCRRRAAHARAADDQGRPVRGHFCPLLSSHSQY
jgi:hypothetical protein